MSLPTPYALVSKMYPEQLFKGQSHYSKVKSRSPIVVAHLHSLANVPITNSEEHFNDSVKSHRSSWNILLIHCKKYKKNQLSDNSLTSMEVGGGVGGWLEP